MKKNIFQPFEVKIQEYATGTIVLEYWYLDRYSKDERHVGLHGSLMCHVYLGDKKLAEDAAVKNIRIEEAIGLILDLAGRAYDGN